METRWATKELEGTLINPKASYACLLEDRRKKVKRYIIFAGLEKSGYVVHPEDYGKSYIPPGPVEKGMPLDLWPQLYKLLLEAQALELHAQGPLVTTVLYSSYANRIGASCVGRSERVRSAMALSPELHPSCLPWTDHY